MSYKDDTIANLIKDIEHNKVFLPALQRKFVWGKHQIELLFDSLMRNYPIGTFLFWRLPKQGANNYVFYEFLKEYDDRTPFNRRKTGEFLHPEITGVLDGQQRLSSMFIGLMGTHTEKTPYKRQSNPNAYEKMCLYLNLLSLPYIFNAEGLIEILEDQNFEFRFLTDEKAAKSTIRKVVGEGDTMGSDEPMFWMKVGKVLSWEEEPEFDEIIKNFIGQCQITAQKEAITQQYRLIRKGLTILHKRIHDDKLINYFEVKKDDLEDILKIFIRVNSGGTVLTKTNLLFSTIVATWDDGREQIENLLKEINAKGDGFTFESEYLMRCCLVLSDGPVVYKVNSFKSDNVQRIQNEWPKIADAVRKTVDLLVEFGFSGNTLTSQNSTIIIAYYLYKGGNQSRESKRDIRKYLIHALLNGIYGSSVDQLLSTLRNSFRKAVNTKDDRTVYQNRFENFSFLEVLKIELPQQKSLAVTESDIERFLHITKGPLSFYVLSLLYPQLRYNQVAFHQDHIHPASSFTEKYFRELGISHQQKEEWKRLRDCVPNLQLMEGKQNISKNATPLQEWVDQMSASDRTFFFTHNFFPPNIGLEFKYFIDFFNQRKEILRDQLKKVLAFTATQPTEGPTEWEVRDEEIELQLNQGKEGSS